MRNNNIPAAILATALATTQLQAFVVPSVAMAEDWDEVALASSVSILRKVSPWQVSTGHDAGTKVKITIQVMAAQECGQFWVIDPYLTSELEQQKLKLVLEGDEVPHNVTTNDVAVQPLISDDGRTLGFMVPGLHAGQTAGIEYCLSSANNFNVIGNENKTLVDWLVESTADGSTFVHFGTPTKQTNTPTNPKLNAIERTDDAYANGTLTVSLDTRGGNVLDKVTVPKRYANAVGSQIPTPTKAGDVFQGWFFDSALTQPLNANQIPSNDFTLYAQWGQDVPASSATPESTDDTQKTNAQALVNKATTKNPSVSTNTPKSDLVPTGVDQTVAVIVSSISAIAGLSVMVLKRLQRR